MWVTIAQVKDITGLVVDAPAISRAERTLELLTGLIAGADERVSLAAGGGSIEISRDSDVVRIEGSYAFTSSPTTLPLPSWAYPTLDIATSQGVTATASGELVFSAEVGPVDFAVLTRAEHGAGGGPLREIDDRDRYFLRLATAYQVAFMHDNPDMFSRADVTDASQDGESASFRNPDAHLLAPLARKALRRLSWRSLTLPGDRTRGRTPINVNSEEYDDSLPWVRA